MRRRRFFPLAGASLLTPFTPGIVSAGVTLPMSTVFRGERDFYAILKKAQRENWAALPIGDRIVRVGRELHGRPYEGFTLEIHDRIESPSVNLKGLDCWTFFEICLGFARMLGWKRPDYSPKNLLREIEFTRYRAGVCHGNYLDRIHYLAEWFFENEARGVAQDITRELGGARRAPGRKIQEMTILWKSYRYLKKNPSLRTPMAKHERDIAKLPVYFIPKTKVAKIEHKLRNGDIAGIVTHNDGGFCSHVGLITRTGDGKALFFHASRDYRKVVIDKTISGYLHKYKKHAGVIIARPWEVTRTVQDRNLYHRNLKKLGG